MKKAIYSLLTSNALWPATEKHYRKKKKKHLKLKHYREEGILSAANFHERAENLFSEKTVLSGPFQGLTYNSFQAVCSTIYPKLIGCYEQELHSTIEKWQSKHYHAAIDIGCAEGYYAIGMARLLGATTKIYAYDTDKEARSLCTEMAKANSVQISIGEFLDKAELLRLPLGKKSLIMSDCEGYENQLFDDETIGFLQPHDVLIECHDFIKEGTTRRLSEALSSTHKVTILQSNDDAIKAKYYHYDFIEKENFSELERSVLFAERRPAPMQWIFAESQ